MKKICSALLFFLLSYLMSASTDLGLRGMLCVSRSSYTDSSGYIYRLSGSPYFGIGISNYNLFLFKEHFGIYGTTYFVFRNSFTADSLLGIAAGTELSQKIRVQGGPAFHFYFDYSGSDASTYFGLGHDLMLKINFRKELSSSAGFSFSADFHRINLTEDSGTWYYENLKNFSNISLSPFIGISYNFQ